MPRDPLAWLPLLRHWTQCLGQGPDAIPRMGDLGALPELDMAALLPGGPGWSDVQRSLRHDPEGAFRLLYHGLALRSLVAMANGTRFEVIVADDASSGRCWRQTAPPAAGPWCLRSRARCCLPMCPRR